MTVKKVTRTVEIPAICVAVQFDEKFYYDLLEYKKQLEEKLDEKFTLGEYIMESMDSLGKTVNILEETCKQQDKVIKMFMGVPLDSVGDAIEAAKELPEVEEPDEHMYH